MNSDTLSIIVLVFLISFAIFVVIFISIKLRRGGGSMTSIALGATDEFLSADKSKAAEIIVNENAGKRFGVNNPSGDTED